MSDNILSQRFLFDEKTGPAWHGKGVGVHDMNPSAAWEVIGAGFNVHEKPLTTVYNGTEVELPYKLIYRDPLPDVEGQVYNPETRKKEPMTEGEFKRLPPVVFGVTSPDWVLVTPQKAVELLERGVRKGTKPVPVETMGLLGNGSRMFTVFQMPSFSIAGVDEVRNYLFFYSPTKPGESMTVLKTKVRVVCENTFRMAMGNYMTRLIIPHTKGAEDRALTAITDVWGVAQKDLPHDKEILEALAKTKLTDDKVKWIAATVYKDPTPPNPELRSGRSLEARTKDYEVNLRLTEQTRDLILDLYRDPTMLGDGDDLPPALRGTAYAALQTFAKVETYRKGSNRVASLIDGYRASALDLAYQTIAKTAKVKVKA